jgi:hypothetical protein
VAISPGPDDQDARDSFIDRVRVVQQRLAKAVARAGLRDDPYGDVIAAQSDVMDVLVETAMLSTPSISAEDIDRLNKAAGQNHAYHTRQELSLSIKALAEQMRWQTLAQWGGIAAALLLIGGAIDRWVLPHPAPDLAGMQCGDQTDRSRVCWVVVTPPPQPQRR